KEGAFALSHLSARFRSDEGAARSLAWESIAVSAADPGTSPDEVLDAKATGGWSVSHHTRRSHFAVCRLKEPLPLTPGGRLTFTLANKQPGGLSLRHFRLSATA